MPRILCVDSGQTFHNVFHILEQAGCEVVAAESSQDALGVLARQPIDGVVLGYSEGNTECLSLRNQIRHVEPYMPVLLLSEHGSAMRVSLQTLASYVHEHSVDTELACH